MKGTIEPGRIFHVTGDTVAVIDERLNRAVDAAQAEALREGRHGVLVTRHGPGSYTVAVSIDVAYGLTQEREGWHDRPALPSRS